jgi:hypothetical protein
MFGSEVRSALEALSHLEVVLALLQHDQLVTLLLSIEGLLLQLVLQGKLQLRILHRFLTDGQTLSPLEHLALHPLEGIGYGSGSGVDEVAEV